MILVFIFLSLSKVWPNAIYVMLRLIEFYKLDPLELFKVELSTL